jgi:hypothetical protein
MFEAAEIPVRELDDEAVDTSRACFIYGQKIALQLGNGPMFILINSPEAAKGEKQKFEKLWNTGAKADSKSRVISAAF